VFSKSPKNQNPMKNDLENDFAIADAGSYRDFGGQIFNLHGRILRTVTPIGQRDYEDVRDSGVLDSADLVSKFVSTSECTKRDQAWKYFDSGVVHLLEHQRLDVISYPYEWTFNALKDAALFHLKLQLQLLERNFCLVDAAAYNVQFVGATPLFIDRLSVRKYQDGQYWLAHQQFCDQFLNPLLMHVCLGCEPNSWYRGHLEGIPTEDLSNMLPLRTFLSPTLLAHVHLPAAWQRRARKKSTSTSQVSQTIKPLPRSGYAALISQLFAKIGSLQLPKNSVTTWQGYRADHGYSPRDREAKLKFVRHYVESTRPNLLVDLGCNGGEYSQLALDAGARKVVAIDFDHGAADATYLLAKTKKLAITTLQLDVANESPAQGWRQRERSGFSGRFRADGLLALALVHHLAIGRNIPLSQLIPWLIEHASQGVIEFPSSTDKQVTKISQHKKSILESYTQVEFLSHLSKHAKVVMQEALPDSGRLLVWYQR
jgi:ribosomal protein L11 methylase PrmA